MVDFRHQKDSLIGNQSIDLFNTATGSEQNRERELIAQKSPGAFKDNYPDPINYSQKKFAFRDPKLLIDTFFNPETQFQVRAALMTAIGARPTPFNMERLEKALRNDSLETDFRSDAYKALIWSRMVYHKESSEFTKWTESLVRDSTLPEEFRMNAVKLLCQTPDKANAEVLKNISLDIEMPPRVRIAVFESLAYEGREGLKKFAFDQEVPEPARIDALRALSVLRDSSALNHFADIAEGKNRESSELRLEAIKCGMEIEPDKFLAAAQQLAQNGIVHISINALRQLRQHFPKEMIACISQILESPISTDARKSWAVSLLRQETDINGNTIGVSPREFLVNILGKENADQFIASCLIIAKINLDEDLKVEQSDPKLPRDHHTLRFARSSVRNYLDSTPNFENQYLFEEAIDILKNSPAQEDKEILFKVLKNHNITTETRLIAAENLGVGISNEVEEIMLNCIDPEVSVKAAMLLYKVDPSKGHAALRELIEDPAASSFVIESCASLKDEKLIELLVTRTLNIRSRNRFDLHDLVKIGNAFVGEQLQSKFADAISSIAKSEAISGRAAELQGWSAAILKCQDLGIANPLKMHPETLCELVKNRTQSDSERAKDKRPVAVIFLPKVDRNGFTYNIRDALRDLTKGYRVMLYEAKGRESILQAAKEGAPKDGAELMVYMTHGTWDRMSFSGGDPGLGAEVDASNGIAVEDTKRLIQGGLGKCLKKNGRIFLISCSVGADGASADNIANMFRKIVPEAKKGGIIAPRTPTTFERFKFDRNGKAIDFKGSADHYQAWINTEEEFFAAA